MNANKQDAGVPMWPTDPWEALRRIEEMGGSAGYIARECIRRNGEQCRAASGLPSVLDLAKMELAVTAALFHYDAGDSIGERLKQTADLLRALSRGVPEGMVLVPKAEFVKALEAIKVPKMSPLKQELFKAGTHAVIRAFNDVLDAAIAAQRKGD